MYQQGYESGVAQGLMSAAAYNLIHQWLSLFYKGVGLIELWAKLNKLFNFYRKTPLRFLYDIGLGYQLTLSTLIGRQAGQNAELFCENTLPTSAEYESHLDNQKRPIFMALYHIQQMQICFIHGQSQTALNHAQSAEPYLKFIVGHIALSAHNFYTSLSLLACYAQAGSTLQKTYWSQIEQNQTQFKQWAALSPANFQSQYLLVQAEIARLKGNLAEAINAYDEAISLADEQGFLQLLALAP